MQIAKTDEIRQILAKRLSEIKDVQRREREQEQERIQDASMIAPPSASSRAQAALSAASASAAAVLATEGVSYVGAGYNVDDRSSNKRRYNHQGFHSHVEQQQERQEHYHREASPPSKRLQQEREQEQPRQMLIYGENLGAASAMNVAWQQPLQHHHLQQLQQQQLQQQQKPLLHDSGCANPSQISEQNVSDDQMVEEGGYLRGSDDGAVSAGTKVGAVEKRGESVVSCGEEEPSSRAGYLPADTLLASMISPPLCPSSSSSSSSSSSTQTYLAGASVAAGPATNTTTLSLSSSSSSAASSASDAISDGATHELGGERRGAEEEWSVEGSNKQIAGALETIKQEKTSTTTLSKKSLPLSRNGTPAGDGTGTIIDDNHNNNNAVSTSGGTYESGVDAEVLVGVRAVIDGEINSAGGGTADEIAGGGGDGGEVDNSGSLPREHRATVPADGTAAAAAAVAAAERAPAGCGGDVVEEEVMLVEGPKKIRVVYDLVDSDSEPENSASAASSSSSSFPRSSRHELGLIRANGASALSATADMAPSAGAAARAGVPMSMPVTLADQSAGGLRHRGISSGIPSLRNNNNTNNNSNNNNHSTSNFPGQARVPDHQLLNGIPSLSSMSPALPKTTTATTNFGHPSTNFHPIGYINQAPHTTNSNSNNSNNNMYPPPYTRQTFQLYQQQQPLQQQQQQQQAQQPLPNQSQLMLQQQNTLDNMSYNAMNIPIRQFAMPRGSANISAPPHMSATAAAMPSSSSSCSSFAGPISGGRNFPTMLGGPAGGGGLQQHGYNIYETAEQLLGGGSSISSSNCSGSAGGNSSLPAMQHPDPAHSSNHARNLAALRATHLALRELKQILNRQALHHNQIEQQMQAKYAALEAKFIALERSQEERNTEMKVNMYRAFHGMMERQNAHAAALKSENEERLKGIADFILSSMKNHQKEK